MPRTIVNPQSDHGGIPPIDDDPFKWEGDGGGDGSPNDRGASRQTSMTGLVVMMSASVICNPGKVNRAQVVKVTFAVPSGIDSGAGRTHSTYTSSL